MNGVVAVKDDEGRLVDRFSFSNDKEGIVQLASRIRRFSDQIQAVMESTGNYWIGVYETLESEGISVVLANPVKTRIIAESRIKSDRLDASLLADLLRANLIAECYVPRKEVRSIRALVRHRVTLVKMRTQIKNRIHAILDKHNVIYQHGIFTKVGLEWLQSLGLPEIDRALLTSNLQALRNIESLIEENNLQIAKVALNDEKVNLLMGFTGIDYYTAVLLLYEIADVKRFPSPKKLISWAGLAPSLHQSGDVCRTGGITKTGNKWVRWILCQAAHKACLYDPKLSRFYKRVSARRGENKAVTAVARKMLVSVYHVLSRNEPYHGERSDLRRLKTNKLKRRVQTDFHA